jgi:hypothetical protein
MGQPAASPRERKDIMPRLAPLGAPIATLGFGLRLDSGLADDTGSHGGRSYRAVNCDDTLSDSLVRATVSLLKDCDLRWALKSGR